MGNFWNSYLATITALDTMESLTCVPSVSCLTLHSDEMPEINNVIFNDPATIVIWDDGTKTIVKCQKDKGDVFNKEAGLALAIAKKAYGNRGNFNDILKKWCDDEV